MRDYAIHFAISALGAGIGAYAQQFCKHWRHRFLIATPLLVVETVVTVQVVG